MFKPILNAIKFIWNKIPRVEFYWAGFGGSANGYGGISSHGLPYRRGSGVDIGGNPLP